MHQCLIIHPGKIAIQVRDYATNSLKKAYSANWTKIEGEDRVARQSEYDNICKYADEPFNSKIKMTATSGTMTIDAIWIYK